MKVLVVKSDFGGHERGSTITDPQEIEAVLSGENAQHVSVSDHEGKDTYMIPTEKPKKTSK